MSNYSNSDIVPGRFYPLGAKLSAAGVNFALYSQYAKRVNLLLFDEPDGDPVEVIPLPVREKYIWHVFVPGLKAGQLYGYQVEGDYNPAQGLRFNPHKLLIDPYAKAVTGKVRNTDNLLLAYDPNSSLRDLSFDTRDNFKLVPKSIVVDDAFDWQGERPGNCPLQDLIIYEVHLKGFTAHPSSGVKNPGTYLGFMEKIPYLKDLGVNAVEFLPLHEFYVDDFLREKGLTNYWGYNSIAFFAPESSYAAGKTPGCQVNEFKTLVRELHKAGLEVILDVVYNHTGEGNELGPTISLRGVDNPTYYALAGSGGQPYRYYMNYTGCGNSIDIDQPQAIRLVMDSLRYWVQEMHVDGFRFDLASVLGRQDGKFGKNTGFFETISQDPVLTRVKLIAEPWDLSTYQVGNFPVDWSEWNGKFRDTFRKFAKGDSGQLPEVGKRLTGSADLYGDDGRSPYNSINFITCHDGFTLHDLVSYNEKHNEANLEGNRDGTDDNNSWNCGAEGETNDPDILNLRKRLIKNHLCYLMLSLGTPMLLGGDECMRTQQGNNNAYCQDNPLSWFDWGLPEANRETVDFFKGLVRLVNRYRVLQQRKVELSALNNGYSGEFAVNWYGTDLKTPQWGNPEARTLCYQADGYGKAIGDYSLFLILNGDWRSQDVTLPLRRRPQDGWRRLIDTSLPAGKDIVDPLKSVFIEPSGFYLVNPRTTVLLGALGKA